MSDETIQPCPYPGCGKQAVVSEGVGGACVFCLSRTCSAVGPIRENVQDAIAAWNSVAQHTADAARFQYLAAQCIPYFHGFQLHLEHENLDIRAAIDTAMKDGKP